MTLSLQEQLTNCVNHMNANGIQFTGVLETSNKFKRFSHDTRKSKPDEWYICQIQNLDIGDVLLCHYGTYSGGLKSYTYDGLAGQYKVSPRVLKQRKEFEKQLEENHKLEMAKKQRKAIQIWECAQLTASNVEQTAYLQAKGVADHGLRYGIDFAIMPIMDIYDTVQGVQLLYQDKKRIYGAKKGNFYQIGKVEAESIIYICEGYATGASVHLGSGQPVFIALDCGNLNPVAEVLRKKYGKRQRIVIAGDDDAHLPDNPGMTHAMIAAKRHGCETIFPNFAKGKFTGTDFNDVYMQQGLIELKTQLMGSPMEKTEEEKRIVFKRHSMKDLVNRPAKEWYVNQLFGKGDLGEIFGAPGSGKTFVTIDLILSLCTGRIWANSFEIARPFEVAYCAGEGLSGLPARFQAGMKHYDVDDVPNFSFFDEMPQFFGSEWETSLDKFVDQCKNSDYRPDILIIDTLHTSTQEADENSAKDMGIVLKACRSAMNQLGCAVIFIHHTNKTGGERGSTAMRAAMDFMIKVEPPIEIGRRHKMFCDKLKDGERWNERQFDLQNDGSSAYVHWNDLTIEEEKNLPNKNFIKEQMISHMLTYPGIRFTATDFSIKTKLSSQYCGKLLTELNKEKKCIRTVMDESKPKDSQNPWKYFI